MRSAGVVTGITMLGLYLLNTGISIVRPGSYLPPAWVYLRTALPLVAFVVYRLLRRRTYHLWNKVILAVLVLTSIELVAPWAPLRYARPITTLPVEYYLLTGAPLLGALAVFFTVRVVRWRRVTPAH